MRQIVQYLYASDCICMQTVVQFLVFGICMHQFAQFLSASECSVVKIFVLIYLYSLLRPLFIHITLDGSTEHLFIVGKKKNI